MVLLRDLTPGWFYEHSPYRDPPEPPDYWVEEIRRMTDVHGILIVLYRNQDGETFVMDADLYDEGGERRY